MNLLAETLAVLKRYDKRPEDVLWVGCVEGHHLAWLRPQRHPIACGTWQEFERIANFEYAPDQALDGTSINLHLKIVGNDWWLERIANDGTEWWEFKTLPTQPRVTVPLTPRSLHDDAYDD